MKTLLRLCLAFSLMISIQAEEAPLYELRIYYANPGKLDSLHARFRDHTLKLFEKHGMTNLGYWVPTENDELKLVYLLSYPDLQARKAAWKGFLADEDWQAAYKASTADGKLVAKIEKQFLKATDYTGTMDLAEAKPARLFELREYETNPGKLKDLDARFRDHTCGLFAKHGMTNLLYMHLADGEKGRENMLIYLIAHQDEEARTASFDAFREDPAWQEARMNSEKNGKILIKGGVTSTLLEPTDYSPIQ
ncbi:MAG: NIPSNAP family protein [Verrucomicrobiota bacterium]